MGTKNNPGRFDCHASADPDEPLFTLRAKDPLAPALVRLWAKLYSVRPDCNKDKVIEAMTCAAAMEDWKAAQ